MALSFDPEAVEIVRDSIPVEWMSEDVDPRTEEGLVLDQDFTIPSGG